MNSDGLQNQRGPAGPRDGVGDRRLYAACAAVCKALWGTRREVDDLVGSVSAKCVSCTAVADLDGGYASGYDDLI